jgi:uncharacterized membrane protein
MAKDFLSKEEREKVIAAIDEAEKLTSGEIRVHIEKHCPDTDPLDRAANLFASLKMQETEFRNGVLLYLAFEDHLFAIIGDAGINTATPDNFWDEIKNEIIEMFKENRHTEGLILGIIRVANALKEFFPPRDEHKNELPNEISFGR